MNVEERLLSNLRDVLNPISLRNLVEEVNKDNQRENIYWLEAKKAIFNLLERNKVQLENNYKISTTEKQDGNHES